MFQNSDIARLLMRLAAGLLIFHGIHKLLHGIEGIKHLVAAAGLPEFFAYGVYLGEVIAPAMVILGYYSRIGALLMVFTMANAIYLAHASELFALGKHGAPAAELPLLYLLLSLAVAFAGPGKFALNRR
jgi:putative oxidoreductase